jgi:hypothetical protein
MSLFKICTVFAIIDFVVLTEKSNLVKQDYHNAFKYFESRIFIDFYIAWVMA